MFRRKCTPPVDLAYARPIVLAGTLVLALLQPGPAAASPDARALTYHRRRTRVGITGMSTLTAWSVANIAGGTIGNFTTTGQLRFFHQGNALWNSVNLVIGVVGLVHESRHRARPLALRHGRRESHKSQIAYIVNAGLDVLYVATGAALWRCGPTARDPAVSDRLVGYGQALVLQGSFLFAFDVAMALAHQRLPDGVRSRDGLSVTISPRAEGGAMLGLRLRL